MELKKYLVIALSMVVALAFVTALGIWNAGNTIRNEIEAGKRLTYWIVGKHIQTHKRASVATTLSLTQVGHLIFISLSLSIN